MGLCIFFTEIALTSSAVRKPKSTLPIEEAMGCEMFMTA